MERHKCKLCTRSFPNGRALGGHMKAHLAAHPLPPKSTQQSTESASSSSSKEELEMKVKSKSKSKSQNTEVAEDKSLGYGLRNNPKKSFRFADPEFSFAVEFGSVVVQDRESETESKNPTWQRSKRNRKLFYHHQKPSLEIKKPKLKKPSCVESPVEPEPVSSVSDTSPEEDVAMCLMMLSRDVWMTNNNEEVQDQKNNVEIVEESKEIKLIREKHKCEKFKKAYHAPGRHKTSCGATETKNAGKIITDEKIFECPFCYKVFGSGQALGGHKRSHLANTSTIAVAVSHCVKFDKNLIDLNLPAPLEYDDFSVISDA